jgi:dihydrodipicolinate reductase
VELWSNPLIRGTSAGWSVDVNCREIQISDVEGKTIRSMRLMLSDSSETEVEIDFTDGTSFSSTTRQRLDLSAELFIGGTGEPQVLKTFTAE